MASCKAATSTHRSPPSSPRRMFPMLPGSVCQSLAKRRQETSLKAKIRSARLLCVRRSGAEARRCQQQRQGAQRLTLERINGAERTRSGPVFSSWSCDNHISGVMVLAQVMLPLARLNTRRPTKTKMFHFQQAAPTKRFLNVTRLSLKLHGQNVINALALNLVQRGAWVR